MMLFWLSTHALWKSREVRIALRTSRKQGSDRSISEWISTGSEAMVVIDEIVVDIALPCLFAIDIITKVGDGNGDNNGGW